MIKKVLFIVGPTSSGKTDLAFYLAHLFPSSVINADSRQVYKKLDIISGKDLPENSKFHSESLGKQNICYYSIEGLKIYLLDIINPEDNFSISDYTRIAFPLVEKICQNNILPIVVGGSGFYIKALIDGVETIGVPPNIALRKKLEIMSVEELKEVLKKEDNEKYSSMNKSDINNKFRLIRAIEVGKFMKNKKEKINVQNLKDYDCLIIGLSSRREELKNRIDQRVKNRIDKGAIKEAESLFVKYKFLSNQVKTAGGYKQLFEYFLGKYTFDEAIKKWRNTEYLIAKKQMTWFKKDKRIVWLSFLEDESLLKIGKFVSNWYNKREK